MTTKAATRTKPAGAPKAPKSAPKSGIEILADVVIDHDRGLMWTREDVQSEYGSYAKFERAVAECRIGGYSDWQVPEEQELITLRKLTTYNPCIDTEAFPTCKSGPYWSKTECAWNAAFVWVVLFLDGSVNVYHRAHPYAFGRAVRRVSSSQ